MRSNNRWTTIRRFFCQHSGNRDRCRCRCLRSRTACCCSPIQCNDGYSEHLRHLQHSQPHSACTGLPRRTLWSSSTTTTTTTTGFCLGLDWVPRRFLKDERRGLTVYETFLRARPYCHPPNRVKALEGILWSSSIPPSTSFRSLRHRPQRAVGSCLRTSGGRGFPDRARSWNRWLQTRPRN